MKEKSLRIKERGAVINSRADKIFLSLLNSSLSSTVPVVTRLEPETWSAILSLAERHRVVPILKSSLEHPSIEVPDPVSRFLDSTCLQNALNSLERMRELHLLLSVLESNGIRAYPYKGPLLALLSYGNLSKRVFGDLDLIVSEGQVLETAEVLRRNGYQPCFPWVSPKPFLALHYEYRFRHIPSERILELKWRVAPSRLGPWAELGDDWTWRHPAELQGRGCFGPELEELFVLLVIHGTKHLWSRLQWLCDLIGLMSQPLCWGKVLNLAARRRAKRPMALAFLLLRDNLDVALPSIVTSFLSEQSGLGTVAEQIRESWFDQGTMTRLRVHRLLLQLTDSPGQAGRYLVHTLFCPTASEILAVPFELPWVGLYFLVRPARYLASILGLKFLQDPREYQEFES